MKVKAGRRKLGWLARVLIAVAAAVPLLTFLFPLWTYAFDAPQYPEGLMMEIWVHKLGGRVDLINGLNHYVGFMRLEAADFWELKVLPAAVIVTVVAGLLAAVIGSVRAVRWWLIWYGLFAVLGMTDFYRWLYKFGNTVDPMAAITMEGYTPPMLGTSQFMNFYITAWPSWGAAALAGGMILGLLAFLFGLWRLRVAGRKQASRVTTREPSGAPLSTVRTALLVTVVASLVLSACSSPKPATVVIGGDTCEFCGMLVSDPRFAAQVVTVKGKTYMFDAIECFVAFLIEGTVPADQIHSTWVVNFDQPDQWLPADEAYYLQAIDLHSPMGANLLAFRTQAALDAVKAEVRGMQRRYADLPALVIDTGLIDRVHAKHGAGGMHEVHDLHEMAADDEMSTPHLPGSPVGQ